MRVPPPAASDASVWSGVCVRGACVQYMRVHARAQHGCDARRGVLGPMEREWGDDGDDTDDYDDDYDADDAV